MKKFLLLTAAAMLLPGTAYAMPAALGGIGALIGGAASGISLGSIAIGVVSMGAQWLLSKMMAPEQKQRGIKTRMETGGDNPPSFIVGEYATSGQLVYANVLDGHTNIPESLLVYVICLSTLPIEAVSDTIYINNEKCTIDTSDTFSGFYAVDEYVKGTGQGGYCSIKFHLGDQNNVDPWLMDNFGNDPDRPWDNDFFLPGCAYAVIRCWYSNRGIWTGLPEFRFTVKGAKFYDPRKDSTVGGSGAHRWNNQNTWEYTKNPKVIEYNFVRGVYYDDKHYWGGRAEEYRLPLDYWFAAMNVCDENILRKDGETINRYEIGAEISLDDKPIEVINEINKSCDGYTTEYGGTYKTWCGGFGLSVGTITDDDWLITAELETNRFQPRQNTYNTAYTTYPEPKQQWEVKDGPRYQDEDAVEDDGEELALDLALPFVAEANQAQRVARAAIKDSRRQLTHAGQLPPFAYVYEPFDRLTYVSDMFGYIDDGKDFIVATKEDLPNVNQQILLREINPDDHAWLVAYEQDWEAAPLVIIGAPTLELDVDVFADQVEGASGKDKPAIRAEWDWGVGVDGPGEVDVRYIDWRIRRSGATKIIARGKIESPEDDEGIVTSGVLRWAKSYEIQFRAVPFGIRASEWTAWKSVTMSAVDVPANLSLTAISDLGRDGKLDFFVKANWDNVAQESNGYGVKITVDGDDRYHRADDSRYKFPVKAPSTVQVAVRTRASDGGTPSAYCTPVSISVTKKSTAPTTPTQLIAVGKHRRVVIKTEDHPDEDFRRWNVYYSKTNNFVGATRSKHSRNNRIVVDDLDNGEDYYFWLTAEDTSGNESAKYPSGNTAGVNAKTSKLDDDDTEDSTLAAPSGLSLTKVQDTDEDGKVQTYIKMDCTAPGWATSKATYVYSITVGSDEYTKKSDDTKARFRVNKTGVLHTVKVRAIKGHGNKSSWSGNSTITPSKKATGPTSVTGFTVKTKPAGNRLKWDPCTDADYKETIIYRNTANNFATATEVGRVTGNRYLDQDDNLVEGTTYHYWPDHVNFSGVAASGAGTPATDNKQFTLVTAGDTETTTLAAPTGVSQTQAAKDVDLDGTVDIAILATFSGGVAGASDYEFEFSRATTSGGSYTVIETKTSPTGKCWFKASTVYFYKTRVRAISWNGVKGAWSSLTSSLQPTGVTGGPAAPSSVTATAIQLGVLVTWSTPAELDYAFSEICINNTAGASAALIYCTTSAPRVAVAYPTTAPAYVYVRHANTSGLRSGWTLAAAAPTAALEVTMLDADSALDLAERVLGSTNSGSLNVGTATETLVTFSWVCASTTTGIDLTIGSVTYSGIAFANNQPMSLTHLESGGGTISVSKTGGGSWKGARLSAIAKK